MEGKPKLVLVLKGQLLETVFLPFDQGLSVRNKCTKSMFNNFYRKYFKSVTIYAICLFTSIECTGIEQWKPAWHYCFLAFKMLLYSISISGLCRQTGGCISEQSSILSHISSLHSGCRYNTFYVFIT